jgi:hypothetical protein
LRELTFEAAEEHLVIDVLKAALTRLDVRRAALFLNPSHPPATSGANSCLLWERTGFWLMIKRLEADRFKWPKDAEVVTLSVEQLHWLLAGIDLSAMRPHPERKYLQTG